MNTYHAEPHDRFAMGGWRPACHVQPKLVFTTEGGVDVWGGAEWALAKLPQSVVGAFVATDTMDTRAGMAEVPFRPGRAAHKGLFDGLHLRPPLPIFRIPWDDYDLPFGVSVDWWDRLADNIDNLPSGSAVAFSCTGGHGRTGTALAIMAGLLGATDAEPVDWIRKRYCSNAVETAAQLAYVATVTGLPVSSDVPWSAKQELLLEQQWQESLGLPAKPTSKAQKKGRV